MAKLATQLIHAGETDAPIEGAVVLPIFQSATFASVDGEAYDDIRYIRLNNTPNHRVLQDKLAAIAGGEAAVVMGSGMAAISTALLALLRSGDHILAQDCLYGGTHSLLIEDLPAVGVTCDFIQGNQPETWADKLRPTTRLMLVETMTNPLLEVTDLEAVVAFGRQHGLLTMIDNTFASPVNFRPLELGFDVEVHSATKYLNGHSDIVAGCVISTAEQIKTVTHKLNHLGGSLDPHACFLFHRGVKTLELRMQRHNENGQRLAEFLAAHAAVEQVNYPGLATHPQHQRAERLFAGYGGVLSFTVAGGTEAATRLIKALKLPVSAPSLGGVETLVTRPATTSHGGMTPAQRAAVGIGDGLVRVAAGIEAAEDLCEDLAQALERCSA